MHLIVLVICAHLGMAAVDLPGLWKREDRRREFWAVTLLLLLGLGLALALASGHIPISAFKVIKAIVGPIGTALFKPKGS